MWKLANLLKVAPERLNIRRHWNEFWDQSDMDKIQALTLCKRVPVGKLLNISAPVFLSVKWACKTTFQHGCGV